VADERLAWQVDPHELGDTTGLDLAGITPEWAWGGATGGGVRVAVVDSGIEADHPDLEGCIDVASSVVVELDHAGQPRVRRGHDGDEFGHGTACAGIIHAIAPEATITSVAVLGPRLSGKAAVFHRGLAWAIDAGFDVVNLSLGTKKRDWALRFYELCDWGYFRNSVIVTAANNRPSPAFPSLYASVLSVAACNSPDPTTLYWNPTAPTEFLAPGIDLRLAWRGGTHIVGTGNSYAAPHVAGLAALVRSKHPQLRPLHVKAVLSAAAANVRQPSIVDVPSRYGGVTRAATPPAPVRRRDAVSDG
jgi:subtilisin